MEQRYQERLASLEDRHEQLSRRVEAMDVELRQRIKATLAQNVIGRFFAGALSNVAFYTSALSASRIQAHYNAGIG